MENRSETDSAAAFDESLAGITDEANQAADVPANAAMEAAGDPVGGAAGGVSLEPGYCEEVIASACAWHAEAVREEFIGALEPLAGRNHAERIANRAAMSPTIQKAIAKHGAAVAEKYGVARFVNAEAALIGAVLCYVRELHAARKDRDALIAELRPKPAPEVIAA